MPSVLPRLYAIVDPARNPRLSADQLVWRLVQAGVELIQYRDKAASTRRLYETSLEILGIARAGKGALIVNDRADVALLVGADGVHVGQTDLPVADARKILPRPAIIGISTHNLEQVKEADASEADYIAFGPIFETVGKERPDAVVGLEGLRRARELTRKPLVAIGGITRATARAVIAAGADSIAVIGDLIDAPDPAERAREFLALLKDWPQSHRGTEK